ncbi:permease-like cell division protein FtsX [Nonomuraea sp. NPDC048916]|uniref:permease-like cell division protein FtsX n=1 Tax=Nonomuraea sp. NPDC048916 TaxID=3154232 RepID=UPI0033D4350D
MNSPVENRLREALVEAGATIDPATLMPLQASRRRRVRVDFRLVTAGVAVVLAGVTTALLVASPGDEQRAVAADPSADPVEVSLFLCGAATLKSPDCREQIVTEEKARSMREILQGMPDVTELRYEDQMTVYADFRQRYASNRAWLDAVAPGDLTAVFRLKLKPETDVPAFLRRATALGGVAAFRYPKMIPSLDDLKADKTDVSVFLCAKQAPTPSCGAVLAPGKPETDRKIAKAGKAITLAQLNAVAKAIATTPGIRSMSYESQQEAYERFRKAYADNKVLLQATRPTDMPTSFRLQLDPKADWDDVVGKLRRMDGVASVVNSRCETSLLEIQVRYGVLVPAQKLCGTRSS